MSERFVALLNTGMNYTKSGLTTPFFGNPHNLIETFPWNVSTTGKEKGSIGADSVLDLLQK